MACALQELFDDKLEYWSVGVMGVPETQYSITPPLQHSRILETQ